jgi:hypothetical protein
MSTLNKRIHKLLTLELLSPVEIARALKCHKTLVYRIQNEIEAKEVLLAEGTSTLDAANLHEEIQYDREHFDSIQNIVTTPKKSTRTTYVPKPFEETPGLRPFPKGETWEENLARGKAQWEESLRSKGNVY